MNLRIIDDISDLSNKYVLLRDDFNVQIENGKIVDTFRIEQSMPTINKLRAAGARVVICAHLGRPKNGYDSKLSLQPVADYLKVPFVDDCLKRDFLANMKNGDVVLLENLRFYKGEEENDDDFTKRLACGFDVFVNDAFAVSHRVAASIVGITKFLPSYAGILLQTEIENITSFMEKPKRPLLAIVGGAKVSTKIGVLKSLCKVADTMIVGGALGTTFNYALGLPVGHSLYELEQKQNALDILDFAKQNNCRMLLPIDKGVGQSFDKNAVRENRNVSEIKDTDVIIDAGINTTKRNVQEIENAKTVIWNGTFGMAEWGEKWGYGSFEIAKKIAEQTKKGLLDSLIGGGETVAALDACGVRDDITYVSTGGGAFLEFIEGKDLPGISVLKK